MRVSKTKYLKILPLVLGIVLFALQACSNAGVSGRIDNQDDLDGLGAADYKQELGIKSANQILETMEGVMGISRDDSNFRIRNYFAGVKASLPSSNDISSVGASQINTIHNLAYEFCDFMMDSDTFRRNFFAGTDFENSTSFSPDSRFELLANILAAKTCGPQVVETDERIQMIESLESLARDLKGMGTGDTNTIRGVCTAALSSACVTQF